MQVGYKEGLLASLEESHFQRASKMLQTKLSSLSNSDFCFFAQSPLLLDCQGFIDIYNTPHMLYLSKSQYFLFRKRDGLIVRREKYPENFFVDAHLAETYLNWERDKLVFLDYENLLYGYWNLKTKSFRRVKLENNPKNKNKIVSKIGIQTVKFGI